MHAFKCFGKFQVTFISEGVAELLAANKENMHFLHLHLEFFLKNLGVVDANQGEIFHQDIQPMKSKKDIQAKKNS